MLKIVVCVKAVPDPKQTAKIKIDPIKKTLMRSDIPLVINPLDRHAMEAGLQLKQKYSGHIAVISMGPPSAEKILKECLALGADQGILLSDRAFGGADAFATARTLAAGIKKIDGFDVIICGMFSSDGATEWVGPEIAVMLDIPVVTMVSKIVKSESNVWQVKADVENGYRLMQVKLPALFTVTRVINTPSTMSFSGIIKARNKQVTKWTADDLMVSQNMLGLKGSPTIVRSMDTFHKHRKAEMIIGTREEKAVQFLKRLVDAGLIS